ncbi:MAG: hypothetical protein JXA67_12355 [Micromonosporaceae bacterium]|nr:hypothetical protein [Micromonosporaceae bacterium]
MTHVGSGDDLWKARNDLFPNRAFLPRVEQDLAVLRDYWLEPVKQRLAELQTATARWDVSDLVEPQWPSRVTPESASRKKLCHFADLDGEVQLFDLHARFTPGGGSRTMMPPGAGGWP